MSIVTLRELEFLVSLRRSWERLYRTELRRLLRELDEPYLLRPRAPPGRRPAVPGGVNQRPRRVH